MPKCCVDGCANETWASGQRYSKRVSQELTTKYCRKHCRWLKERGTLEPGPKARLPLEDRFWRKVPKGLSDSECWNWLGAKSKKGYGNIGSGGSGGRMILAHRLSYQIHNGDLKDSDYVLHSCDNPSCVNPSHLRKGTQSENIIEAFEKNRKTNPICRGEESGKAKLTDDKVRFILSNPDLGHKEIADMFGLSPNCIRGVRIGRTWTHVKLEEK